MTAVPDRVLQWLYASLKPQYQHVDRTYSDVAQALQKHNSLAPRTEVHTFDNGSSALLLLLQGTLPVQFRGAEYRFPIAIWVPHAYPREPPMVFVTPTPDMVVRPGQHVSAEGRVYHPYLANWGNHWDKANLMDALYVLMEVFGKEPPVIARQPQVPRSQGAKSSKPVQSPRTAPPPPPPKPPEVGGPAINIPARSDSLAARHNSAESPAPPALPPKPGQVGRDRYSGPPPIPQNPAHSHGDVNRFPSSRLSPLNSARPQSVYESRSPRESVQYDPKRSSAYGPPQQTHLQQVPQQSQPQQMPPQNHPSQISQQQFRQGPPSQGYYQSPGPTAHPNQQPPLQAVQSGQPRPKPPVQDLMSAPLEVPLPANPSTPIPAPPIPPNPEKDALLHAISTSLVAQTSQLIAQNNAALPSLQAQNAAMQQAYQNMSAELSQLQSLDAMLSSNEKILHETMRDADRMMEGVKSKQLPSVDDVLVAPTVVGEQLYGLVAEIGAIEDVMFALTRALDRGRVPADVYIKQMRSLAREQFLKKALVKKIARGMNLSAHGM